MLIISLMNIAFWDNQLCERGTTTSLFDYAFYNQKILKNGNQYKIVTY